MGRIIRFDSASERPIPKESREYPFSKGVGSKSDKPSLAAHPAMQFQTLGIPP